MKESERTLPASIEAEEIVLGTILAWPEAYFAINIDTEDFYREAHRHVFESMKRVVARDGIIDVQSVKHEMDEQGPRDSYPGTKPMDEESLRALLKKGMESHRKDGIAYWARVVKDKACLRRLIAAANRISQACFYDPDSAYGDLEKALKSLNETLGHIQRAIAKRDEQA